MNTYKTSRKKNANLQQKMLDNKSEVYEEQGADPFAVNDANTLLEVYGKKKITEENKMNSKTKNENLIQFIELYKNKEVLWNMNSSSYRRNDLKSKAYEAIAKEMSMSVEDVKKKIKSIRNTYIMEKNKVDKSKKSGCGTDTIYKPTLFWYEDMSFLNTSIIQRKTIDNSNKTCLNTNDEFGESSLDATFNLENSSSLVLQSSQASALSATTSLKRKRNEEPSKFDSALNKLLELNQKNYNVYENFAENIAAQLGGFPEDDSYILMAEIQTMVSKRKVQSTRNALNTSRILTPMPDHINVDNTGTPDVYYGEEYLDSEFDI